MFIYLSKKIAIPHGIKLQCVSWNTQQGWIACGGANGMLKVLKLDQKQVKKKGAAAEQQQAPPPPADASNLQMNQTLEGHNGSVMVVTWNENYRKLTTSDEYGLIIVWMLHKGMWFEEMINNRNKSVVKDMKWTSDGQKICIIYEDGAVIVGSVDGNRLWGKELDTQLALVEWSPEGRNILFATLGGEVHVYDGQGSFLARVPMYGNAGAQGSPAAPRVIGLQWYKGGGGYVEAAVPTLAVCFDNGRVQLMRDEQDDNPVLIDTGMLCSRLEWNSNGSVLAIAGARAVGANEAKDAQMVQFYSPFGKHLRTLKVPGSGITSVSWEGGALRLALAVDSYIYFANIRPDYRWAHINASNTLVYAFSKPDRPDNCVCFWDTTSDERHIKYVKKLLAIRAGGEHCVFATRTDDDSGQYILILCNAIGSPVDSKYIDVEPVYLHMTSTHVLVANDDFVYVWQYRSASDKAGMVWGNNQFSAQAAAQQQQQMPRVDGREVLFHIDDTPTNNLLSDEAKRRGEHMATNDPVCAVTASQGVLIVARASGTLLRFSLPSMAAEGKYVVRCRPQIMSLNCNNAKLAIIDINGVLTLYDLEARASADKPTGQGKQTQQGGQAVLMGKQLDLERKDAWDMKWSEDDPDLWAVMEKTRMYVLRGVRAEEPVLSSAFLCHFNDLTIKAVNMDDIMVEPEHPDKECIVNFETKALRDTRELLATTPIGEAFTFVEDHPHPRLWRLLAEAALEQLNFLVAEKAFVRCSDYQGLQFVKRLKLLNDRNRQRAEVCAYFKRFEEAERQYLDLDLADSAVELRTRLGDWFRVLQLIQSGAGDDALAATAYNNIADYYADRQKWLKAYKYYAKAKNVKELLNCAYVLDDYEALDKLVEQLSEGSDYLRDVGHKFASVGLCAEAVQAFLKASDTKEAIDTCITLNQWDQAVKLAEKYNFPQIEALLTRYASVLLDQKKLFDAIGLYRKANKSTEAAKLLCSLAEQAGKTKVHPLRAKKLYVLAGLETDRFRKRMLDGAGGAGVTAQTAAATFASLIEHDTQTSSSKAMENPWHGAEAYHFWLLAQRQLYGNAPEAALRTAVRLMEYEDVLDARDVYSLIALAAFYSKQYGQCSRAFIKLESLEGVPQDELDKFKRLALSIFTRYAPHDPPQANHAKLPCFNNKCNAAIKDWWSSCPDCGKQFAACVVSGRSILSHDIITCKQCRHQMYEREASMRKLVTCPLCHGQLTGAGNRAAAAAAAAAMAEEQYDDQEDAAAVQLEAAVRPGDD